MKGETKLYQIDEHVAPWQLSISTWKAISLMFVQKGTNCFGCEHSIYQRWNPREHGHAMQHQMVLKPTTDKFPCEDIALVGGANIYVEQRK